MIFKTTVTKKEKKEASKKRMGIFLVFLGLLSLNFTLFYVAFVQKPKPIITPLSRNQVSSNSQLEKLLKENNVNYVSITTQKDSKYLIKLKDSGEVILDPTKDINQELSSLQLILSQLKIEGKTLKRLDFRYQKPIIIF